MPRLSLREWVQALLGLALCIDTLVLLALRKVNTGTVLPGLIGIGLLALLWARPQIQRWRTRRWFARCWRAGQILCGLWLASFIAFVVLLTPPPIPANATPDYILVLGAGLRGSEPSPTLYYRLAAALDLARQSPAAQIIVSGAQGMNEDTSEAKAMQTWLQQHGMPAARILREEQSTSTDENLRFTRQLLQNLGVEAAVPQIAIVTSDFHAARTGRLAQHSGFARSWIVTSPTPASILLNVWLREYFAWGKGWLMGEY